MSLYTERDAERARRPKVGAVERGLSLRCRERRSATNVSVDVPHASNAEHWFD
jgi:hypothetical protein